MSNREIHLVPHTHWDREWYLTVEEFRPRLVTTLDAVLDALDADPGWTHFHLDGQTTVIDDYLAERPERIDDIRRHVVSGRLSCGPWVSLVDEFLVSGESIIRNLEDGAHRAEALGGYGTGGLEPEIAVAYLPDQFGHIGQMPQILRRAGFLRAVLWRGVPDRVSGSGFLWTAPDGSSIEVRYLPFGYGQGARMPAETPAFVERLETEVARLGPFLAEGEPALLMIGDDHETPHAHLPELVAAAQAAGIDASIRSLAWHLDSWMPPLVEVEGELRSAARANLLPNTYSVRALQKTERARAESALERYAEPLAALVPGVEWPAAELRDAWALLHLNGAHDSVCGCSTDEVAAAVDGRTRAATDIARGIVDRSMAALGASVKAGGLLFFNPSPFEREGIPGLGWKVVDEPIAPAQPLELRIVRDRIVPATGGEDLSFTFEDQADVGDLYTFCPGGDPVEPTEMIVDGLVVRVVFGTCEIAVRAWARPDEDIVRIVVAIDNRAPAHRLRAVVDIGESADQVVAGAPFELVRRHAEGEGGVSEPPPTTWPARGIAAAGRTAVLSEGVFEYELLDGRALAVSLIRCVGTISRDSLPTRSIIAGPDVPTPGAQLLGAQTTGFGLMADDSRGTDALSMVRAWDRYALKCRGVRGAGGGALPEVGSLLDLDVPALSSIRRRGDDLVTTVWNPTGAMVPARVGRRDVSLPPYGIETVVTSRSDRRSPR
ncbi:MAG TPA: hypothetical protein VNC78_12520 [Actinomycetota bacterium]|nr:hypothetical protein [Actinomycetota bacterium]